MPTSKQFAEREHPRNVARDLGWSSEKQGNHQWTWFDLVDQAVELYWRTRAPMAEVAA